MSCRAIKTKVLEVTSIAYEYPTLSKIELKLVFKNIGQLLIFRAFNVTCLKHFIMIKVS